ncbi:MAG: 6-phosphofructokinase [Omnitrophica bacterium RIFCSPLOWO2_12_FULL_50_11]|nr:MAG: 6-phosphofructokinase [Omnitrophica bacterium RIFCSPLOWO2_12_FULL_50_11]
MSKRIGILTAGGDCPGLNAVIRAVAKSAFGFGWEVVGFEDGFQGVVENRFRWLENEDVSGILTHGGTILGTSNVANPFRYPVGVRGKPPARFRDESEKVVACIRELGLAALVCIGGDGTLSIGAQLLRKKVPVVGVPKTIDNDLSGTDFTFGFDTAVTCATDAVDRLHTTAASHHRVMVLEVMGRYAGWIALYSGMAGGADVILIPEIPFRINAIASCVRERNQRGKRFSIVVVGEGAKPKGGKMVVKRRVQSSTDPIRLGGIGYVVGNGIEHATGIETRVSVLGHIQRGGSPTARDRNLGTLFGNKAVELIREGKIGYMAALRGSEIVSVPIGEAVRKLKLVPKNHPLIRAARAIGISFGD